MGKLIIFNRFNRRGLTGKVTFEESLKEAEEYLSEEWVCMAKETPEGSCGLNNMSEGAVVVNEVGEVRCLIGHCKSFVLL